jgi:hypothetical protein
MVTDISGAGLSHSVAAQANTVAMSRVTEANRPGQPGEVPSVTGSGNQLSSTTQVTGAYAQIRNRQDELNQAASVVREVGNTVKEADQLLSKMEDNLVKVVKMYPPYPVDNPERISLLNSFGGLRRQIDALTFPPPNSLDAVGRLLGSSEDANAKDSKDTKDAKDALNAETQSIASLIKEPMWDIPTLDAQKASDAEVGKALDQVKAMKSVLADIQSGMWNDVVSFVQQADTSAAKSEGVEARNLLSDLAAERGGISRSANQLEAAAESR